MKNAVHGQSCLVREEGTSEAEYTHILFLSFPHSFSLSSKNEKTKRKKDRIFRKGGTITNNTHISGLPFIWNSRKGKL